jgi:hypothetical protein
MKHRQLRFGRGFRIAIDGSGTMLMIEHQDRHAIRNTGATPLKTVNFYVPAQTPRRATNFRPRSPPWQFPSVAVSRLCLGLWRMAQVFWPAPWPQYGW